MGYVSHKPPFSRAAWAILTPNLFGSPRDSQKLACASLICTDCYRGEQGVCTDHNPGYPSPWKLHTVFPSRELGTQSPVTHHSCVAYTVHTRQGLK